MYENLDREKGDTDDEWEKKRRSSGLLFRGNVYLKRDENYIPLFKIDSVFMRNNPLKFSKPKLIDSLLSNLAYKINNSRIKHLLSKATKVKSKHENDSFYNMGSNLKRTALLDTSVHYVFKTFDDFRNGNYSIENFRIPSDYLGDYLYKKEPDGNEYVVKVFAFNKGGQLCIRINNTYSAAFYLNNLGYTIGSKLTFTKTKSIPFLTPFGPGVFIVGGMEVADNSKRAYQPMMLDMVTGNTY